MKLTEQDLLDDGAEYPAITNHLISLWRQGKVDASLDPNGRVRYRAITCTYEIDDKVKACRKA
jgi:DNA-binding transcriptional ArsR family regulator